MNYITSTLRPHFYTHIYALCVCVRTALPHSWLNHLALLRRSHLYILLIFIYIIISDIIACWCFCAATVIMLCFCCYSLIFANFMVIMYTLFHPLWSKRGAASLSPVPSFRNLFALRALLFFVIGFCFNIRFLHFSCLSI